MENPICVECRQEFLKGERDQSQIKTEEIHTEPGGDGKIRVIRTCSDGHYIESEFKPAT